MNRRRCLRWFIAAIPAFSAPLTRAKTLTMSVDEARNASLAGDLILIDIRTPGEWRASGIPDVAIPLNMRDPHFLNDLKDTIKRNPGKPIGLICAVGGRSGHLSRWLRSKGYQSIVDVPAGVHTAAGWLARQLPVKRVPLLPRQ